MAAPITIKKKKMTLKPASPAKVDDQEMDSGNDEATDLDTSDSAPNFSAPQSFAAASSGPSYTLFGILAIIATLCFMVLVLMQWMEWKDLNTAFPRPIDAGQLGVLPPS